ncbi:MAG: DUF4170 domain-containing protein [Emcibacter sp.]|nr:DUF4170 domain-containing protein [Emcibacter sp.]
MADHLLHLVFGGKVDNPETLDFVNPEQLDVIGIFPNYKKAYEAWKAASHSHVDDAMTKYVIVHLHKLMEPSEP